MQRRGGSASAAGAAGTNAHPPIHAHPNPNPTANLTTAATAVGAAGSDPSVTSAPVVTVCSAPRKSTIVELNAKTSAVPSLPAPPTPPPAPAFRSQPPKPFAAFSAVTDIQRLVTLGMLYFQHALLSDSILAFDRAIELGVAAPTPSATRSTGSGGTTSSQAAARVPEIKAGSGNRSSGRLAAVAAAANGTAPPPPSNDSTLSALRQMNSLQPLLSGTTLRMAANVSAMTAVAAASAAVNATTALQAQTTAPITRSGGAGSSASGATVTPASAAAAVALALSSAQRAAEAAAATVLESQLPAAANGLWPRALTLYYLGRYAEAADQFARDLPINSDDMEESIWLVLCRSHIEPNGFDAAHRSFVPMPKDPRPIMPWIGKLFAGKITPDKLKSIVTKCEHHPIDFTTPAAAGSRTSAPATNNAPLPASAIALAVALGATTTGGAGTSASSGGGGGDSSSSGGGGGGKPDPTQDRFYTNFYLALYYEARAVSSDPDILNSYFITDQTAAVKPSAGGAGSSGSAAAATNKDSARAFLKQSIALMTAAAQSEYRKSVVGRDDYMCSVAVIHCLRRGVTTLSSELVSACSVWTIGVVQEIALELGKNQTHFYCLDVDRKWPLTSVDFNRFERESLLANPSAINNLGFCYCTGQGVERNEMRAFQLFTEAANTPVPAGALASSASGSSSEPGVCDVALNNIAVCYACGIGVNRDRAFAFKLFSSLAAKTPQLPPLTNAEYTRLFELPACGLLTDKACSRDSRTGLDRSASSKSERKPKPVKLISRMSDDDDSDEDDCDFVTPAASATSATPATPASAAPKPTQAAASTSPDTTMTDIKAKPCATGACGGASDSGASAGASSTGGTGSTQPTICGGPASAAAAATAAAIGCPSSHNSPPLIIPRVSGHGRLMAMVNLGTLVRDEIVYDAMTSHKGKPPSVVESITTIGRRTPETPTYGVQRSASASCVVNALSNELLMSETDIKACPSLAAEDASASGSGGGAGCPKSSGACPNSSGGGGGGGGSAMAIEPPPLSTLASSAAAASAGCNSLRFSEGLSFGPVYDSGDYVTLERKDHANMKAAMNWYERVLRLTNGEYAPALCKLALYFATEDKPRSRYLLDRARALGHLNAVYVHALDAWKHETQRASALNLMEQCAAAGYAPACVTLAAWSRASDVKQTVVWLQRAVAAGSQDAKFELAVFHLKGTGMRKNVAGGLAILRELAGPVYQHARSQLELARYYADGVYVQTDIKLALGHLEAAAKNGRAEAQFMLAGWLLEGTGGADGSGKDKSRGGSSASTAAAAASSALAAPNSAICDMERAVNWLTAAALQEHDPARQLLTVLHHLSIKLTTGHQTKLMIWRLMHSAMTGEAAETALGGTSPPLQSSRWTGGSGLGNTCPDMAAAMDISIAGPPPLTLEPPTSAAATNDGFGLSRTSSNGGGSTARAAAAASESAPPFNSCVSLFRRTTTAGGAAATSGGRGQSSACSSSPLSHCESATRLPALRELTVEFWDPRVAPKDAASATELSDMLFSLLPLQAGLQELHIHMYTFSAAAARSCVTLLRSPHCMLSTLSFDNSSLQPEMVRALFSALRANRTVTLLSMSHASFGPEAIDDWVSLFARNPTSAGGSASACSGGSGGSACATAGAVTSNNSLARMDSGSRTPPPPAMCENDSAPALSLLTLQLNGLHLSGSTARTLLSAMTHASLTSLNLQDNRIGHTGAVAIGNLLRASTPGCIGSSLTNVNLSKCELKDKSLVAIGNALVTNNCLTALDVSHSAFSDAAIATFCERIKQNSSVYELVFSHCSLGDTAIQSLASLVMTDPYGGVASTTKLVHPSGGGGSGNGIGNGYPGRRLWRFRLHGNPITPIGCIYFAEVIAVDAPLLALSINSQLGSIGAMCMALRTNTTLTVLQLARHRKMKDPTSCDCAPLFASALSANRTLRKLLSPCGLGRFNVNHPPLVTAIQQNRVLAELDDARFITNSEVVRSLERNRSIEVGWQRVCVTLAFVRATSSMSYCLRTSIISLLPEICRFVAHSCPTDVHGAAPPGSAASTKKLLAARPGAYLPFAVDAFMDSKFFRARCSPVPAPTPAPPALASPKASASKAVATPSPPVSGITITSAGSGGSGGGGDSGQRGRKRKSAQIEKSPNASAAAGGGADANANATASTAMNTGSDH